ncbi:MAG TPA: pyruvate dehydrogenase (acetyl-transferring) E1 component subunit alpha [Caldisericia bacterium]|nr:pyruvate dehydrogenase (acetyl-transferring) E1 component subunit alpha [Caldisericia bacterium]HOL82735.1 pyruvate dehydrogenase (acetyl-transferring) E1 component subunit alpha [Caldisericia bacterium]HPC56883.1 pyruvate dehydrogenase (acetyl-transferring) E1 component subunit alpha [Caldisericia bacterium]HPP43430.1 pyruvate dehydrogenase (acetyl-transferring) E1 component subunit alpha [Caldisericia bacterium]HRT36771.1 pyruvate dehydrogenase (acetyl-transferring) E1 component subunit al
MEIPKETLLTMYERMVRIRKFEEKASELFAQAKLPGFIHLYIGQEASGVGVCAALRDDDYITSTHRGHGNVIAKGGEPKYMMAELYGKITGYCKGKGGSMHIADAEKGILGANGIVGAGLPIATGAALSIKLRKSDQVVVCFFGDGASNQGTFHESINMGSLWKLPVVYVCENNQYGEFTSQKRHQVITDISQRATAYGIPGVTVDGMDVLAVYEAAVEAVKRAREGNGPTLLETKTYRFHGHFEGDPQLYRDKAEVEEWMRKDPIPRFEKQLLDNNVVTEEELKAIQNRIQQEIDDAVKFAEESPYPEDNEAVKDIYTDLVEEGRLR